MRVKSKYRQEFRDGGRVDLPGHSELPIEQPVESASPEAPAVAVAVETTPEQPQPEVKDEAALALQRQIEELRQSEAMQRERATALQQPLPVTREQKLSLWRSSGMSEEESAFLQRNPTMIDFSELTGLAVRQAQQAGHQRGTNEFSDAVKKIFHANFQGQAESSAMPQRTPEFFRPLAPAAPKEAHFVSAPVSRDPPGLGSSARPRGRVTLSREEVEAAKMSNLTLEEYAAQKQKYAEMRSDGSYRDERETQR